VLTVRQLCLIAAAASPFPLLLGTLIDHAFWKGLALLASVALVSAGAAGFQFFAVLAAVTGWKTLDRGRAEAQGRAGDGHRLLWLAGAALMLPLHYPAYVVAGLALADGPVNPAAVRELLPFAPDPRTVLGAAVLAGLLGARLATLEPAGHGQARVRPARETPAGADYAARLAARQVETTAIVAAAEAAADTLAATGDFVAAAAKLRAAAAALGGGHPEAERLSARADAIRRGAAPRAGGDGPAG